MTEKEREIESAREDEERGEREVHNPLCIMASSLSKNKQSLIDVRRCLCEWQSFRKTLIIFAKITFVGVRCGRP